MIVIARINREEVKVDEPDYKVAKEADTHMTHDTTAEENPKISEEGVAPPKMCYYLKQRRIFINLIIMTLVWLAMAFGYYLIISLVNTFAKIYETALVSSASEMIAYIVAALIYEKVGVKITLILAFGVSTIGGLLIIAWGLDHQESTLFFVFFLLAKFGVAASFNVGFIANLSFFPTLFSATALGLCTFFARLSSAFSYPVSSLDEPQPMIMFTSLCALTFLACFFLIEDKKN